MPHSESLADVQGRLLPYWNEHIVPQLAAGQTVLLGAHGNSLRALVKQIESISNEAVVELEIATGTPRIYEVSCTNAGLSFSAARVLSVGADTTLSDHCQGSRPLLTALPVECCENPGMVAHILDPRTVRKHEQ
jgi:broad specificity phosphatase PhoE